MKTIEMKVGNSVVHFTTKSVTIDGAEFFYGKMSEIKHSASKHVYAFKYNGEVRYLPYDPKYEKALKTIFAQVNSLHHDNTAHGAVANEGSAPQEAAADVAASAEAKSTDTEDIGMANAAPGAEDTTKDELANIVAGALISNDDDDAPQVLEDDSQSDEIKSEEAGSLMGEHAYATEGADKKGKKRKAIIVLAAMIVLIGLLSVGYFMIFGTSSNPSTGTNSTQTQQYDDIDQLIDDLNDK